MLFLLVRIFPLIIPVIYFFTLRAMFAFSNFWYLFLLFILVINILAFYVVSLKRSRKRVWFFLLYAEIFSILGFLFILVLGGRVVINFFLLAWSLTYLIYLESVFNYLYRTEKFFLIELKSISSYIGVAMSFLLALTLLNFYIFLRFSWWLVAPVYLIIIFVLVFDRFLAYNFPIKTILIYSGVITVILFEFFIVLLWWPTSMYVSAIILSIFYYLLSSLGVLFLREKLTKNLAIQYFAFAILALTIALMTAQWL